MDARVAGRYARALFSVAVKDDILASVEDDLNAISSILHRDQAFHQFLYRPDHPREEKIALIEKVFSDRVTALTMGMFRLLLNKRREVEFELLRLEFQRLRRDHENVIFAQVASARPLSESERQSIEAKLSTSSKRRVEAEYSVEPSLMGGVRVSFGNYVLDGSVKGSLSRLKETLIHDLLKQNQ